MSRAKNICKRVGAAFDAVVGSVWRSHIFREHGFTPILPAPTAVLRSWGHAAKARVRAVPVRARAVNERIAVLATGVFGSMWTTYGFFLYGFIPVIFPATMTALLYWSNTVQLWSLPLIAVGTAVLGRASVRQARETHDAVMEVLGLVREELALVREERELLRQERAAQALAVGAATTEGSG